MPNAERLRLPHHLIVQLAPTEMTNNPTTPEADPAFHYPPDLLNLLVDAIRRLCRSKSDVLVFFSGAGTPTSLTVDLAAQVATDKDSISKAEIARMILTRLNAKGDVFLRQRREILKRVTQWEDFSTCWETDRLEAMGLVSSVRRVVNVHDSFTRINIEREQEQRARRAEQRIRQEQAEARLVALRETSRDLAALFRIDDAHKRGKDLEGVLNRLFKHSGVLVREAFTLRGWNAEGVIEQIDGVVEIDGEIYLVEMKWLNHRVDKADVSEQLVRVFSRSDARGLIISASGFTDPAITTCREALHNRVVVLCELDELVHVLEAERDVRELLKSKVNAAILDKNPLHRPLV
ncbi:MAG: restriction endonuclease [Dehalococcoidia bacterium]